MKRGDVVVVAPAGNYGKPRPAVIVQADTLLAFDTIAMALTTTALLDASAIRPRIIPSESNGLREPSDVMIDKVQPVHRNKVGAIIGHLADDDMERVTRCLAVFFGLAD